ncbi:MAG: polyketide cyclase [Candidatus Lambdaproteobacteria bacterium RIFOXYD1_FULL_56_27]|uniref:Polyketide cyclase n=1 Tax=Candidatus Lambdaproteobacteria bacterium RIFOXYD2_FULL_56_26 TaxID=1817773 RepID=A0A1F6GLX4_9PROT|nr:MAG: polyketide cyclase [Candidatus Lambdaproteobacteria bacterium RIFOXYD2_FULL_56_26]OGH01455.1 MAG: polyketide cyclase [Candidatus Lambdaproteobacteria bacterium RIFOXYC1_FULL_56_13]OGH07057.1 MAG: polyketide cyclase [Candidatus Lambdaproteobacteria bacterium RIFOXYD1_FULL_56_27]
MVPFLLPALALLIAVPLAYAATKPNFFLVERRVWMAAPADQIFGLLNDFRQWEQWTPYDKDPQMVRTYGETTAGVGATYGWSGNKNVGAGRMTLTKSQAPTQLSIELQFFKPFAATNLAEFTLKPQEAGTLVTWALSGKSTYTYKVMGLLLNMDKMVGGDFEIGLSRLKTLAEQA